MPGIPELRKKRLAERLRRIAAEERDPDVARAFCGWQKTLKPGARSMTTIGERSPDYTACNGPRRRMIHQ